MGYPITIHTHHKIVELMEQGNFVLSNARTLEYMTLLTYPDVSIKRCATVNPAERIQLDFEAQAHNCVAESLMFTKLRPDLESTPLLNIVGSYLKEYFVDVSCYKDHTGNHTGYVVVQKQGRSFTEVKIEYCPQPCSA